MSPLAYWLAQRTRAQRTKHHRPHFECMNEQDCDGEDEPGIGHVCQCSCRDCSITTRHTEVDAETGRRVTHVIEVCICGACDARECGLHVS